jgi:lauroyl/myristoyl acyltransferase
MKLTLMRLMHTTPGLRAVSRRIHPIWFFKFTYYSVSLADLFWPHARKLAHPFRQVVGEYLDEELLHTRARRHLLFLRLFKELELTWSNWQERDDWISIEGEDHLANALKGGKGAILASCHNFGFSKLVAPALSRRGYRVQRGGGGKKDNRRVSRWGNDFQIAWEYLDYRGDYWHKLQTLKAFQAALAANRVLHVSPRAYLEGKDETAVKFFGRTYFLDPRWFRILQICRAPVLPCFAVADTEGRIRITIHPALPTDIRQMAAQFARLQSDYLTKFPELGRFWKAVYLNRSQW